MNQAFQTLKLIMYKSHLSYYKPYSNRRISSQIPSKIKLQLFIQILSNQNKTRHYILHDYKRFNKYWNLLKDTINQLVVFLKFNPSTFSFHADIIQCNNLLCLLYTQLLFFLFFFFFLFTIPYVSSYKVAIIVCYYAPYNKLLIFF